MFHDVTAVCSVSPSQNQEYRGLWDCLSTTARREGVRGIYKGLWPSSIKAMATTGLHFTFYELAIRLMRQMHAAHGTD